MYACMCKHDQAIIAWGMKGCLGSTAGTTNFRSQYSMDNDRIRKYYLSGSYRA